MGSSHALPPADGLPGDANGDAVPTARPPGALPLVLASGPHFSDPAVAALFKPSSGRRPPPARPPPANPRLHYAACWAGEAAARARDAEAFKGGMTVKEINAAFGERAGELKKPAKRVGLIDMGLIHLFMM